MSHRLPSSGGVLEVSSVVESILATFQNGMDVFVRLGDTRQKQGRKPPRMKSDELQLHESLTNRPKEIRAEYDQSVAKHGKRFEKGDNEAYASLAHTLFVLNTGLMTLINTALSRDAVDKSKSRQSLLLLSEKAATDTVHAFDQLSTRLSTSPDLNLSLDKKSRGQRSAKQSHSTVRPVRPGPSPILERGGWVRTRSGSSVVSATTAKRQATANTNRHQRSKSLPIRTVAANPTAPSTISSAKPLTTHSEETICGSHHYPEPSMKNEVVKAYRDVAYSELKRPPSMLLVPADYFTNQSATEVKSISPPPIPPKIPIYVRPNARSRPRPDSAATFLTASTRLGEIPESKWPNRSITEEDREELPLPYVIPPPLESPARRSRGLKFWKKSSKHLETTMYN